MKSNCIFCKIIKRELSASIFYEDDEILGFLNHRPVHAPECLLIPKQHIDHFTDIDDQLSAKIMVLGQQLARKIRTHFKPEGVGYVVAGYGVAHAHLIVIPQYHDHDITSQHFGVLKDDQIVFTDEHIPIAPRAELDQLATQLAKLLNGQKK